MIKQLSCILFTILITKSAMCQAPPWQWAKDANSTDPETVWEVAHDNLSNTVYAAGSFKGNLSAKYGASFATTTGNTDGFVAKYDAAGTVLWAFKIAGSNNDEEVRGMAVDPSGDIYVTGTFNSSNTDFDPSAATYTLGTSGNDDGFLAKYSSAGAFVWAVKFGGSNDESTWKMSVDANGVYITGSYLSIPSTFYSYGSPVTKVTAATDANENMFGAKYSLAGIAQWVISGGGNKTDIGFNVIPDAGNVYFIGRYDASITFRNASGVAGAVLPEQQNNKPQVYILAVTQAGNLAWQTNITTSSGNVVVGWSLAQDASNLYVTGYMDGNINFKYPSPTLTQNVTNNNDLYLARLTKTGTFIWNTAATGNGPGDQIGRALDIDLNGNIVLGGNYTGGLNYTSAGGPNFTAAGQDMFITSYSNTGTFLWSAKAGGPATDNINGLSTDNAGGAYIGGDHGGNAVFGSTTLGAGGNTDIFVAKLACPTLSNNTITASQTICAGNAPSTLNGSVPTGGTSYTWQMSANSVTWTTASGTFTNQNYSPPPLTTTTYYRRNVTAGGGCSSVLNSNTITISADQPPSVSNAGATQTVCATSCTLAAVSPTSGSGIWSVITGTGNVTSVSNPSSQVTGLSNGTNSFAWTVSNGVCPTSTSTVTIIRNALPNSNAGSNQTICVTTATLAALTPTAGSGTWSVISGTANVTSSTNPTSPVNTIATGTNILVWTVTNGVCPAATSTVTIARDIAPTSNSGSSQTVCASSATLSALNPTMGNGSWSVSSGTATVASVNSPSSPVNGLSNGINSFVWTVTNGVCPASTSTVTVNRNIAPSSNAGSNQAICAANATLAAFTPTVGSGSWSVVSGTANVTSATNPSSPVNSIATGTTTFAWTVTNGVCPVATSTITIARDIAPSSNAGSNQTLCTSSATLSGITPTTGSGSWSVITGTSTVNSINNPASTISGLSTGTNSFVWTVTNGVCPAATSTVSITRDIAPVANAGSNQTICIANTTLAAFTPTIGSGSWSVISGTATVTSATNPSSPVNAIATGTNILVWTVTNGVCPAATSTMIIARDIAPSSNAGSNQTLCTSSATLGAANPTAGFGNWSVITGTSTVNFVNNAASSVSGLGTGTNSFVWTVTNGVCPAATSTVNIMRDITPTSNAGSNQIICAANATLAAFTPTIGSGSWSVISGTATVTSATNPSSPVNAIATGTNILVWTVTNGVCPAATSAITIARDIAPSSNAGTSQTVCAANATLSATPPTIGNGTWSVITGTSTVSAPANFTSAVSALSTGTNSFIWTVTNGSCPAATSTVTIMRDIAPLSNAGISQTICTTTATLSASSPTTGNGAWSVIGGTANIVSAGNPTSTINSIASGTNTLLWTVTNGVCPAATSTVNIIRSVMPTANAGSNQTVCTYSASLSAVNPTVGSGSWSVITGTATVNTTTNPASPVNGLGTGTNSFVWTVTNGSCPVATSTISISRDIMPVSNAGSSQTLCTTTATLAGNTPAPGSGSWSVISGPATVNTLNNPSSAVNGLSTGINSFVWTVTNGVCPAATSTIDIIRDALPDNANAGTNFTVCASACTINANMPVTGTGGWSVLTGASSLNSPALNNSPVSNLSAGTNQFVWTVSNGTCPPSTSTLTVYAETPLMAANAGADQHLCSGSCTLNAISPDGNGTWIEIAGTGTISTNTQPTTTINGLSSGDNVFVWLQSKPNCPSNSDTVIVKADANPTPSNAGNDQLICGPTTSLAANLPVTGSGMWQTVSGTGNYSNVSSALANISNLSGGANALVWTISNGVCPSSSDTIIIISDLVPSDANAGPDLQVCSDQGTLTAVPPATGTGSWTLISGSATFTNSASTLIISLPVAGPYIFRWTVSNGVCPDKTDDIQVTRISPPGAAQAGSDQTLETSTAKLNAVAPTPGNGRWSVREGNAEFTDINDPQTTVNKLGVGNNILIWTTYNGNCPENTDDILIYVKPLVIPNGFSPNGDGMNDRFVITSLDYYEQVKFSVFNRWGALLYTNENYKNDWAGTNSSNEKLVDDTYYYSLEIKGYKNFTGFIVLKQNR